MGKYMRKSKAANEVALLEVTHTQSSLGVRTRARTLALQRLQRSTVAPAAAACGDSGSYMQLRSRRLQKPPIGSYPRRQKPSPKDLNPSSKANQDQNKSSRARQGSSANSSSVNKGDECLEKEENVSPECNAVIEEENGDNDNGGDGNGGVEASFGENLPEFEARERSTRESTPCSLIRDPDAIQTPGSSTRPTITTQVHSTIQNASHLTTHDMDEFFSDAEVQQQRHFIEKYNYDPVNDKPLPGRYEWEKINP